MRVTEEMVTRFLNWPLPKSVRPDPCVMDQEYPHRIGTNLMTAGEARQMLEHVLESVRVWVDGREAFVSQRCTGADIKRAGNAPMQYMLFRQREEFGRVSDEPIADNQFIEVAEGHYFSAVPPTTGA